jgi:hypothetical protein
MTILLNIRKRVTIVHIVIRRYNELRPQKYELN